MADRSLPAPKAARRMPLHMPPRTALGVAAALLLALGLAACSDVGDNTGTAYPHSRPGKGGGGTYQTQDSLFGKGGLSLFGDTGKAPPGTAGDTGGVIGVNPQLWRATLDTLSFMPLASADPFGGEIITDWYSPPQTPDERFKIDAYLLGKQLRADGIKVRIFHELRDKSGAWVDAPTKKGPNKKSDTELENEILTRARQLYIAQAGQ